MYAGTRPFRLVFEISAKMPPNINISVFIVTLLQNILERIRRIQTINRQRPVAVATVARCGHIVSKKIKIK